MTIADKVGLLKQDFDEVYASGYEKGLSEGGGGSDDGVLASLIDRSITEVVIPNGTTSIGANAFLGCSALSKVEMSEGISAIGAYAFKSCYAITGKVTIPEGVTSLGAEAFYGCSGMSGIDLPDSLTTIERYCFFYTKKLEGFILPPNVSDIPIGMLNASAIKEFTARGDVSSIAGESFEGCSNCLKYDFTACVSVPTLLKSTAFKSINAEAKILVPAALYDDWIVATNWAEYADYIEPHYTVSEGLEIDGTSVIGRGSCTDSVIVIPDGITAIAEGAFVNDTMIDTLVLPESGVEICDGSLGGSSLRKIMNCYNVHTFALYGLSIEYISFIDSWGISGYALMGIQGSPVYDFSKCTAIVQLTSDVEYVSVGEDTQIIVPAALYDEWIVATNWAYYADYIVAAE